MGEVSLRISITAGPECERGTLLHITDAVCGFGKVIRHSKGTIRELVQSMTWFSGEKRNVAPANTDRRKEFIHVNY